MTFVCKINLRLGDLKSSVQEERMPNIYEVKRYKTVRNVWATILSLAIEVNDDEIFICFYILCIFIDIFIFLFKEEKKE